MICPFYPLAPLPMSIVASSYNPISRTGTKGRMEHGRLARLYVCAVPFNYRKVEKSYEQTSSAPFSTATAIDAWRNRADVSGARPW